MLRIIHGKEELRLFWKLFVLKCHCERGPAQLAEAKQSNHKEIASLSRFERDSSQ